MLKGISRQIFSAMGYEIVRIPDRVVPPDMENDEDFRHLYRLCKPYTITSIERMYALYEACVYIVEHGIPGDIVECGVYRGGSSMLCALTLKMMGDMQRKLYLYDTYAGMPAPSEKDVDLAGKMAAKTWRKLQRENYSEWMFASLENVTESMLTTGYPKENLIFVKGKVEETIPGTAPKNISLLRLDTDWYESTYHELVHLFPRLSTNGVLIVDDYGHWRGAKEATDQYFKEARESILLHRVDYTCRTGIKQAYRRSTNETT